MENVSIKGLGIAVIITLLLDTLGGIAGIQLFAEAMTEKAKLAIEKQTNFLLYALVVGSLTTLLGAFISAKYGKLAPYKNASIFGVIGVLMGLIFATFEPIWFDLVAFVTTIPLSIFGGYLVARKNT